MWRRGGRGPRAGRWPAERASRAGASPARGWEGPRHAGSASALVPRALPLEGVGDGTGTPSRSVATPAPGLQRERTLALSATTGLSGQQGPPRGAAASGLRVLTPAGTPARRRGARQACGEGASPAGGTLRAEQTPGRRWTDGRLAAKTVPKMQTRHEENKTVRARRARPLPRAHAVTPSARHARAHWQRTHVCAQPQGRARTHGHAC